MKKIEWLDLVFTIFLMIVGVILMIIAIAAYRDSQSRITWRESTSREMLETVKREAVNEYIKKQEDYETILNNRADRQACRAGV